LEKIKIRSKLTTLQITREMSTKIQSGRMNKPQSHIAHQLRENFWGKLAKRKKKFEKATTIKTKPKSQEILTAT